MRTILAAFVAISASFMAFAGDTEEEILKHRVAFNGMLTSQDSYQLEASYHYMICKYAGVGGSCGYWKN